MAPPDDDPNDLDQLLARWEWFADDLELGFLHSYFDDFDYECWNRKSIHELLQSRPATRAQLDRLWDTDNRIRLLVRPIKPSDTLQWWDNIMPKKPNPEILEELRERGLWPFQGEEAT